MSVDIISLASITLSSVIGVLTVWVLWKQYRSQSPTAIVKRVVELEKSQKRIEERLLKGDETMLIISTGISGLKEDLDKLDTHNGQALGQMRDSLTRMESRIDDLYKR